MLFLIQFLVCAIAAKDCVDNVLWRDSFGWSCKDYSRDPRECSSRYAVSNGGIGAQEACCACIMPVERRRDYASCLDTCSANENACEAECLADKADCQLRCSEEHEEDDDPGGITPEDEGASSGGGNGNRGGIEFETWLIILIVLGILVCLCIICIILYFVCMPRDEGTCEDGDCVTQQPMLVGGGCDAPAPCEKPCDAPCEAPYNYSGQQMAYSQAPSGYPQGQGW